MIRSFHQDLDAQINISGDLTDLFKFVNGVKQGDLLVPTSFTIYFSMMIIDTLHCGRSGIEI